MSDKVDVQQRLAALISESVRVPRLFACFGAALTCCCAFFDQIHVFSDADDGLHWLKAFFDTMVKEWGGIDHLRCANVA